MNKNEIVRLNRENIRLRTKQFLKNSGHIACLPIQHLQPYHSIQSKEQVVQLNQYSSVIKSRRKTSFDIQMMGDTFDMFQCNDVFIFNDFDEIYDLQSKIGEGANSVVYQAVDKRNQNKYAVKITRKKDQEIIKNLKTQFRILKNLEHQSIVKAYNLFVDQKKGVTHLVLEYCQSPNLRFHIMKNLVLKQTEVAEIIQTLLFVVSYLHQQGVCHRDLKPQNIIFDPASRQLKLIDFQIAKMVKYKHQKLQLYTNIGTIYYKAPELLSSRCYNEQADIWSIGVICYQMIMGDFPFNHKYESQLIRLIKETEPKYDNTNTTDYCINFIKKCLQKDPLKRMTAKQALKSPFILKYASISTNSSPISPHKRKTSGDFSKCQFQFQVNRCFDEDSELQNRGSLGMDNGIRVKANERVD